jgi:alkylation response protein AidB-like acyl-CoA dehydrogenase
MDFSVADELADHRAAAHAWIAANVKAEWVHEQYSTGTHQTMELHRRLARDGILAAAWPARYGGTDVDPDFARAVFGEISHMGLSADAWSTTCMVISTIDQVGTESQKKEYIGGALKGEILVALGYSEPDSGSDVAAAKTVAVRDGEEWVINGRKMFTSTAQCCSHVFVLTRTNPEAPKHKGLTLFVVPTRSAGFEMQPIYTLGGQRTNATFYTDVRVPDSARIGGINEGWGVMRVALVYERGAASPMASESTLAKDLSGWALRTRRPDGSRLIDDPLTAERIARIAIDEEVARLLMLRMRWMTQSGQLPGVEGSMQKLFKTESAQRHYSDTLDILGVEGLLEPGAAGAPDNGRFEAEFRTSVVETIRGGSSEILREIIAERRLGLPRNRPNR